MEKHRRQLGIIGVVIVAAIVISVSYYVLFISPQPHGGFISEQKAGTILNVTYTKVYSGNSTGVNTAYFPGSSSVDSVVYLGNTHTAGVEIVVVHYNNTSKARSFYEYQIVRLPKAPLTTINATYRGYVFSYDNVYNLGSYVVSVLNAWCLLKGYLVAITYLPGFSLHLSNATIIEFVHAQMDSML